MKLRNLVIIALVFLGSSTLAFSQEKEEFKASGKPTFKIFSNYHNTFSGGESHSVFELTRAYLGYGHQFSENWSGKIVYDVGNPKDGGGLEYTAYVKNALMAYKNEGLTVKFGLIGTNAFSTQEKFWGNRYMLKSFQDEYKFSSSADFGISAAYKFNSFISADLIVINGEGYKKMEADSIYNVGVGVTLKPIKGLIARAYLETTTKEEGAIKRQNTVSLFLGYNSEKLSVGADYNMQTNHKKADGVDWSGLSAYAAYQFSSVKAFARLDHLDSDGGWNAGRDGNLIVLGAEFNPVKGIKITPNFRSFTADVSGAEAVSYAYINCEIKF
ncbi:porin [bacterium]|nr:porin [bacterium]